VSFTSYSELAEAAEEHGSLGLAVIALEVQESGLSAAEIRARMTESLGVMREAIETGLISAERSRSGLTGGDAHRVAASQAGPIGGTFADAIAAALATGEVNAAMGRIVAAPTGGASGVLPAVVLSVGAQQGASEDQLVDALFAAAGIGSVIAARATLSGAAPVWRRSRTLFIRRTPAAIVSTPYWLQRWFA